MSATYREPDHDDTVCPCGAKLPDDPRPFSWQDHGFCHSGCALASVGAFRLRGTTVCLELARMGAGKGPGFEDSILRPILKSLEAVPRGLLALDKLHSEGDSCWSEGSWAWRLYRTDEQGSFCECVAFRLTPREVRA